MDSETKMQATFDDDQYVPAKAFIDILFKKVKDLAEGDDDDDNSREIVENSKKYVDDILNGGSPDEESSLYDQAKTVGEMVAEYTGECMSHCNDVFDELLTRPL